MDQLHLSLIDDPPKKHPSGRRDRTLGFYVLIPWMLILIFMIAVLFEVYTKPSGIDNPAEDLPQKQALSLQTREVRQDRYRGSEVDTSKDIVGDLRIGYGSSGEPCVDIFFEHSTTIEVHVKVGPKDKFTQAQGYYTHDNQTSVWECPPDDSMWWFLTIKGDEPAQWTGDVTNEMLGTGKVGRSKTEILYKIQSYGKILDPSLLPISPGDEDWTRSWNFQVERELAVVKVSFILTVTNSIVPEVKVTPSDVKGQEDIDPVILQCGTRLPIPQRAMLVWSFGKTFLGSFTNVQTRVLHRGQLGNIHWNGTHFTFHLEHPTRKNTGVYICCVLTERNYKHCQRTNVSIWSPEDNMCTGTSYKPSNPFQINYFHSTPLLRNGSFVTVVWKFNITDWKISTRYPQCLPHLTNLENGLVQWFGQQPLTQRDKRGVIEGILGGVGSIGSLLNTMDINTLKSDLGSIGYIGSKGVQIQKGLNQLLEKMVLSSANVIGSSVSHLQEATLELIESQQEVQISRACLEIQVEYSTNLKMIVQALQSGVTPLGLLKNLPEKYSFSLGHIDLWVNKWLGCEHDVCIGTSLIPVAGIEQVLVPVTVLGIPVSNTQLIHYNLKFKDFVFDGGNLEQLDVTACFQFASKVMCLPGQEKVIYHSCFHNHSSCEANVNSVTDIHELVTQVKVGKICFQVMKEEVLVTAFFTTCMHSKILQRGLYCIEGEVRKLEIDGNRWDVSTIDTERLTPLPVQFNLTQIDHFPWKLWTEEIKKDKGLLAILKKQLKDAEITFLHEQGKLEHVQHQWNEMSGVHWWSNFKKSINMWSKSSVQSAAGHILSNPIVIITIVVLLCIVYQLILMFRISRIYKRVKNEVNKGDGILKEMIKRAQSSYSVSNLEKKSLVSDYHMVPSKV